MVRQDSGVVCLEISVCRSRQPAVQKVLLAQVEVVHGQAQGVGHGFEALLGVLGHHVNLEHLLVVVELKGPEVGLGESPSFLLQADGHSRTKHRQALVQPDDILLVQPQQGPVPQLIGVPYLAAQAAVLPDGCQELAQGRFRQQVGAPGPTGQGGE